MPIHDWSRVDRWLFHDFSLSWIAELSGRLNAGVLPSGYYAFTETLDDGSRPLFIDLPEPDADVKDPRKPGESRSLFELPPRTWFQAPCLAPEYGEHIISIRSSNTHGVMAAIRIVTQDAKRRRQRFASFVAWAVEVIRHGYPLLIVDLFPTKPDGTMNLTKALWEEFVEEDLPLAPNKPLTLVSYSAGRENTAYVEPVAVGDPLPDMPFFLKPDLYVPVPLEATYQTCWSHFPAALKHLLTGEVPEES